MKSRYARACALALALLLGGPLDAQRVIPLYSGPARGSESWTQVERESNSAAWRGTVVANVTAPSLTVYLPPADKATGTSVVICPGGGFYALAWGNEGVDVAKWLAAHGVTAFVLKYRLVKTGGDAVAEFGAAMQTPGAFGAAIAPVVPLAIADGKAAVAYVRAHAAEFGVTADRVGMMGFSAGGTLVTAAAFQYTPEQRPAFLVPVYAFTSPVPAAPVPADAPPMFVVAATDDDLGLAPASVDLYSKWIAAKKPAELHMYARGGHGFGLRAQNIPTDTWIERFAEWLDSQGLLTRGTPQPQERRFLSRACKLAFSYPGDWNVAADTSDPAARCNFTVRPRNWQQRVVASDSVDLFTLSVRSIPGGVWKEATSNGFARRGRRWVVLGRQGATSPADSIGVRGMQGLRGTAQAGCYREGGGYFGLCEMPTAILGTATRSVLIVAAPQAEAVLGRLIATLRLDP